MRIPADTKKDFDVEEIIHHGHELSKQLMQTISAYGDLNASIIGTAFAHCLARVFLIEFTMAQAPDSQQRAMLVRSMNEFVQVVEKIYMNSKEEMIVANKG